MKPEVEKELHEFAQDEYKRIANDLPDYGKDHYIAALSFIPDRMYDEFSLKYPKLTGKFGLIVRKALKNLAEDDRTESRRNEQKAERARLRALKPARMPKAPKAPKVRKKIHWGIGSY